MHEFADEPSIADDMLRSGYERWHRLEEEKAAIGEDLKELFAELKANGFAPKALRESFRRVRNIDDASQQEHDAIVDLYVASLTGARPAHTREGDDDQPDHDAETGEIIEPGNGAGTATADQAPQVTPAVATSSAEPVPSGNSERQPDPEPHSMAAADIQPEMANEVPAQDSGGNETSSVGDHSKPLGKSHAARPASVDAQPNGGGSAGEAGESTVTAGETAPDHPGGDHANSDGKAVASHASGVSQEGDGSADAQPRASSAGTDGEVDRQPIQSLTGSAADKSGEAGGVSPSASPAPTKLKMNAEFFEPADPLCKNPDGPNGCGGNSRLRLCVECRAAAGIVGSHDGQPSQPDASVH